MRRNVIAPALATLFITAGQGASAQDLAFDHLSVEHGLASPWVLALLKDSRGFVWIGTSDGLHRFDGQRIVRYKATPKPDGRLNSALIHTLHEDRKGRLWLTLADGVQLFDREHDRLEHVTLADTQAADNVEGIAEDASGTMWFATGRGLVSYDPETGTSRRYFAGSGARGDEVMFAVLVDHRGGLWTGSNDGLRRFDPATGLRTRVPLDPDHPESTAIDVRHLYQDSQGRIWVSSRMGGGLIQLDPASGRVVARYLPDPARPDSIGSDRVMCTIGDGEGRLYVGTENGGLQILDIASGRFQHVLPRRGDDRSLAGVSIYALKLDDQGILWVGTYNGGVSFASDAQSRFGLIGARREDELSDPHVAAVLLDRRGTLWVGTDGGGLNRLVPGDRTVVYRHDPRDPGSIGSDAILALLEDGQGRIWIGGWDAGIGLLDPRTGRVTTHRHGANSTFDSIYHMIEDGPRHLLLASFGGIERFDRETRTFSPLTVQGGTIPDIVITIARDASGNVWFGQNDGAFRIDARTSVLTRMPYDPKDPTSFGPGLARSFFKDSRGNFWIGFDGGGLRCLPAAGGATRAWRAEDGLSGNTIHDILEDDAGNIWVSTENGLSRLSAAVQLPEQTKIAAFGAADGLQAGQFRYGTSFRSRAGELFFGGQQGLNRFFPSRIRMNTHPPDVRLTGVRLFNEQIVVGAAGSPLQRALADTPEISLSYEQSVVTLEFAALNYILPKKNRYAYRLDPLDSRWNDAGGQSSATYTLSPGDYVFRVKASNNDGVWSEKETELRVVVTPPWWRTFWFYSLVAALIVASTFLLYRRRVQQISAQKRDLEQKVAERTSELAASAESLRAQGAQLSLENEERRRAEEEARRAADEIARSNRSLEEHRAGLEREVNERKKAEEETGRERDLLHALMDHTPDLIYFKDSQSRFTRVNRAQAATLGLPSPEAALGRSDLDFFPPDFAHGTIEDERRLMHTGQALIGHLEHDLKNDRWFLASKVPLRDASGTVVGLVGISKDVSETKRAEQKLERDLEEFLGIVNVVSQGDLTRRSREGEELLGRIACGFNAMLGAFSAILADVRGTVLSVSTSSAEILAAATQIAKGAEHGSLQVNETSAAVEQMAVSMVQVSRDSEASAAAASAVLEHVHDGEKSVNATYQGMARIDSAVGETAEKMELLDRRSREIFEVIGFIQEIAAQSELLSLNAAIEAAHAGNAGRGFSVVADEIRRLAERSKEASRDVTRIVEGMVEEVRTVLAAMRLAMDEVKTERGLSEQARSSLQEIESLVAKSVHLASQISLASREQAQATHRVSQSMQSIASVTTESAAGARETSRAVEHLVRLSDDVTEAIARFRVAER